MLYGVNSVFWSVVGALSNPLILIGTLVGLALLSTAGLMAARRWGWRPVPSVLAGASLGVVLARPSPAPGRTTRRCPECGWSRNRSAS